MHDDDSRPRAFDIDRVFIIAVAEIVALEAEPLHRLIRHGSHDRCGLRARSRPNRARGKKRRGRGGPEELPSAPVAHGRLLSIERRGVY